MEHGRMSGVTVDPVGAPRRDDANFGHGARKQPFSRVTRSIDRTVFLDMLYRVADLHRAGMGAQKIGGIGSATLDIKSVMHGSRRVILGRIERSEVQPVGLNFRALCHVESHRAKDRLNALQRERNRVQATLAALATRQAHVQCFGLELSLQFGLSERLSTVVQSSFYGLLGEVDGRTA